MVLKLLITGTTMPFCQRPHLFQKQKKLDECWIGKQSFKRSKHYRQLKGINMRFVPFPLPGAMDIFGESIRRLLRENATGILISSREIVDHFKQYFDGVWRLVA